MYIFFLFSQSLIFKILSKNDENDGGHAQNATAIKLNYLAKKTKNNKYLVKNECPSGLLDKVYGASPKYVFMYFYCLTYIHPLNKLSKMITTKIHSFFSSIPVFHIFSHFPPPTVIKKGNIL